MMKARDEGPSILLVDDDPAIRRFLTVLLEKDGYDVDAVSDGVQALRKLKRNEYTAVLLDLLMPRVNGFEVLQEVRALRPEMLGRIVVLTAASDRTLVDFADGRRVFRVLRKPLDNAEVLKVVRSCSGRRPLPAARESRTAESH
jgi:CheY-like chemotaxis protein